MKVKITLYIYEKTTKANAADQLPIYVRFTVNGKRLEFSTNKFVKNSKLSPELSKIKSSSEEIRSRWFQQLRGYPTKIQADEYCNNKVIALHLWKNSQEMTNTFYLN